MRKLAAVMEGDDKIETVGKENWSKYDLKSE